MHIDAALPPFQAWLTALYDIHRAHSDPTNPESQRSRTKAEIRPFYLTKGEWRGEPPFARFADRLEPKVATKNNQDLFDQLAPRTLFKADHWSAPAVGGLVRCLVGRPVRGYESTPELVFDLAAIRGEVRIVAMHRACLFCGSMGTKEEGTPCGHVDFGGETCVGGYYPMGGLALDAGDHLEGRRFAEPDSAHWSRYMAR